MTYPMEYPQWDDITTVEAKQLRKLVGNDHYQARSEREAKRLRKLIALDLVMWETVYSPRPFHYTYRLSDYGKRLLNRYDQFNPEAEGK